MAQLELLVCPSCSQVLTRGDYDEKRGQLSCPRCATSVPLARLAPAASLGQPVQPLDSPLPREIELARDERGPVLRWRWFQPLFWVLAAVGVMWNGALLLWFVGIDGSRAPHGLMYSLLALFGAAGLALSYLALAGLVNSSSIRVQRGELEVRHAPLPWFGTARMATSEIASFDVRRRESRDSRTGRRTAFHELWLTTTAGRSRRLLQHGQSEAHMRWIARWIEGELAARGAPPSEG
ncbi:MAG: hypothetical protein IT454_20270 [Planctomycetes bacterium]|nr:hypothetical protein [Planctomycetota bacterium]